ncbi:4-alpha-glucanotransferase [Halopseudomonas laoshanensis]|uniref:4-alpha-glucanotransferase n=1 Tax=Halopseudomonas laoshanensis TaxID=2268758 RepID=A0A7V7GV56_9GAMM|nr:4-alpha-glucanotransferase [Halopseudomonas laoshanensis]KAA0695960.1 4-alpha-glucanotransferase [Halopseudomonas laoshanensis]
MNDTSLMALAAAVGITLRWDDAFGQPQQLTPEALQGVLSALGLPAQNDEQIRASLAEQRERLRLAKEGPLVMALVDHPCSLQERFPAGSAFRIELEQGGNVSGRLDEQGRLPPISSCGYHQLMIAETKLTLATAPLRCQSVSQLTEGQRSHIWGLSAQLYSLRRQGDGGLGDTLALETLVRQAASKGADAVAISPIHAMFSARPEQYSPYSPSSRLLLNPLYASPARVLGDSLVQQALEDIGLRQEWDRLEQLPLIDWVGVAKVRGQLWRHLYQEFCKASNPLTKDLSHFCQRSGDTLEQHCRFEALHAHMLASGHPGDWRQWPEPYRDPNGSAVDRFAQEHRHEVDFHAFCQWLTACSLERVQSVARSSGMHIGVIADLAVGADGTGSLAWARQTQLLADVSVGAPPDILNQQGQDWGVSAFSPDGLQRQGYSAFIDMLRANLAHAGGIRIDHVMGLQRLWVIPRGAPSSAGAYLNYPLNDLLHLVALESWRHHALVIGEDLGTVAPELRASLTDKHLLGMRVLQFEHEGGHFIAPEKWSNAALATTTTHDLPSLMGWFNGRDIEWREQVGQRDSEQSQQDREQREIDKSALLQALLDAGELLQPTTNPEQQLTAAIGFIGRTPAPLVLLPLEDALASAEQPNLPGPGDEHPNWRRRWTQPVEQLLNDARTAERLARLNNVRLAVDASPPHSPQSTPADTVEKAKP